MKRVLTLGIDISVNRIEIEIVGWLFSSGKSDFLKDPSRRFRIVTAGELAKDELPGGFDSAEYREGLIRSAAAGLGMSVKRYKLLLEKQQLREKERDLAEYERSEKVAARLAKSLARKIAGGFFSENRVLPKPLPARGAKCPGKSRRSKPSVKKRRGNP